MIADNVAGLLMKLAVVADSRITGVGLLQPGRVSEVGWFVVQRPDGRRVRIDIEGGLEPNAAAIAAVLGANLSSAAIAADEANRNPERKSLREQAGAAISANDAFLALANPDAKALAQQVRRLTFANTLLLKRLVQLD